MKPRLPQPIHVTCPVCDATTGVSCRRAESNGPGSRKSLASFHVARVAVAQRERIKAGTDVHS